MSIQALDTIALAEEKARQIRAAAGTEAKNALREAEAEAAALVTAAEERADSEIRELTRNADEKAKEEASRLAASTKNKKAAMHARADRLMDEAAGRIVERIVKG